jgi:hypothetical protein
MKENLKMKNLRNIKQVILWFIVVSGFALLTGCAVYDPYNFKPVTVPEIVQMSKEKLPSKHIINEIKKSHTAYTLKASEYSKLQQEGVADSVVNYMEKTHLDLIRRNQQIQDSYYWSPWYGGWYGSFGYGWPHGYWGWNIRPTIIYRGGGDNRGYHGGNVYRGGNGAR